jgi:hypothetical protein
MRRKSLMPSLSPERLVEYNRKQKSRKRSKAARAGHSKRLKQDATDVIKKLVLISKLYQSSSCNNKSVRLLPLTSISLATANYMKLKLSELQNLCRMNSIMVTGTKAELTMKLLRCEYHGSIGKCSACGHSKLQFEYMEEMNPVQLPMFVECKHYYGIGRRCRYGRRPITASTIFVPMIKEWPEGTSSTSSSTSSSYRERKTETLTVVDGFKGAFYLDVKYSEKDHAKELGCRFDRVNCLWYIPKEFISNENDEWKIKYKKWISSNIIQEAEKKGSAVKNKQNGDDEEEEQYPSSYT